MSILPLAVMLAWASAFLLIGQPRSSRRPGPARRIAACGSGVGLRWRNLRVWNRWKSTASEATGRQQLLRQLAALLRAGRQSHQVWKELAQLQPPTGKDPQDRLSRAIRQAALHAQRGENTAAAFDSWWPWLACCFEMSAQQGAPLADLLERYGNHLKEDQELDDLVKVEAAGARMTQRLLLILPLGGVGLGLLLGVDLAAIYFGHPLGIGCLLGGGILSFLASRTSARIITDAGKRQ